MSGRVTVINTESDVALEKDMVIEASTMGLSPGVEPGMVVDIVHYAKGFLRRFYSRSRKYAEAADWQGELVGWSYVDGYGNTLTILND